MPIDFRNTNLLWASIMAATLSRLGVAIAVICPGSRSAPLAVAFAQSETIEAIPMLDERSAAFFALGVAQRSHRPTVLICTSGTAGANAYPAVIEAYESRVPLMILTADRPPELRDCNAGQAIDQQKLYGNFPNWYAELAIPALDLDLLGYLRQTMIQAWERSLYPVAGPVHLNCPFREPLAPTPQPEAQAFARFFNAEQFFAHLPAAASSRPLGPPSPPPHFLSSLPSPQILPTQGILIAGPAQPLDPQAYCEAIATLAKQLKFPVLADGLSPLRNHAALNPYLISTYDLMLRHPQRAIDLTPEVVIRVGDMPTSKVLRQWLSRGQPQQWIVDESDRNRDPLHGLTRHIRCPIDALATAWIQAISTPRPVHSYLNQWCNAEAQMRRQLNLRLTETETLVESKVAWLLSQSLPPQTPIMIANSTPIRDVEWFWQPSDRQIQPFFNRGANGIDGTLSTALGVAYRQRPSVLLTGDLALLHDTNGFLLTPRWNGQLTIVLINNNGGGIFQSLPIAAFDPPFEDFFATPQHIRFDQLCATYSIAHIPIKSWTQFIQCLHEPSSDRIRVLEIQSDRQHDAQWRTHLFSELAQTI